MSLVLVPDIDTQAYMVTKSCRPVDSSNLKTAADAAHSTGLAWSCLHISCQIVAVACQILQPKLLHPLLQ